MKIRPFQLERYFARHEFSTPHLLCTSDCESVSVGDLLQLESGAREGLASLWLGYTESQGGPELRKQIASLYEKIHPEQILAHSGAEEAIFNFMNTVLEAGDEVIVHAPCYQSLGEVARSVGAKVIPWPADPQQNWELDLGFLQDHLSDRTRVVVVNLPHNPTGYLPDPGFLFELSRLSDHHGFLVFSDEVYRGLEYDPSSRLPCFADINERGVSLGVMSKTYGLAGLRIGWVATSNRKLFEALAAFKDYTTICNSAPSEYLAGLALHHHDRLAQRNLGIIRNNLKLLNAFFAGHRDLFAWEPPQAGPIAFPRYLGGTVDDFCEQLRQDAGVLLLPGTVYDDPNNCFRIGFGRADMAQGLDKLKAYLTPPAGSPNRLL